MRLLLDTHVLLWWLTLDDRLGEQTRARIESPDTRSWVSAASVWEAAIKFAVRRIPLPSPPADLLSEAALHGVGFQTLPMGVAHALSAGALPRHHDDPFDRMLIAQARAEDLTVVTSDTVFADYDVRVLDPRR